MKKIEDITNINEIFEGAKALVVGSGISLCDNISIVNNYYYTSRHKDVFISDVDDKWVTNYDFNIVLNSLEFKDVKDKTTLVNIEDTYIKTYSKYKNKKTLTKNYYRSMLKERFIKLDLKNTNDINSLETYDVIHLRYVLHLVVFLKFDRVHIIESLYNKLNKNGKIYIQNYVNGILPNHHSKTNDDIKELRKIYKNKISTHKFFDQKGKENVTIIIKKA